VIVTFSTSSPWASVAAISPGGEVLWQDQRLAPRNASAACFEILQGRSIEGADLFVADVGPGSFTGVRVGVILAKMFGFLTDRPVAGVTSFDLIDALGLVALPSKKGEYFVRVPGEAPFRTVELPAGVIGYGDSFEEPRPPDAGNAARLLETLQPMSAEHFLPEYLIEPSISQPKRPFGTGGR
jgi:hypothetical protein